MIRAKFLKGNCQQCDGHIEFPARSIGMTTECSHCGQTTELLLAVPPQESAVPMKTVVYTAVAIMILIGGLVGALIALQRAQQTVERRQQAGAASSQTADFALPAGFTVTNGFQISPIKLEKTPGSSVVYAVGTVKNQSDRKRFGVKVELVY